jgi:hypothetical protein
MSFAILRGENGRRHEVDFGDDPVAIDVAAGELNIQITVEAVEDGVAPERRRYATIALPREQLMAALRAGLRRVDSGPARPAELRIVAERDG